MLQPPQKEQSEVEKVVVDNHINKKQSEAQRTRVVCEFDKEDVQFKDGFAYINAIVENQVGRLKVNEKNMKLKEEQYTLYTMSDFTYSFYDKNGKYLSKLTGNVINQSYEAFIEKEEKEENEQLGAVSGKSQTSSQKYQVEGKEETLLYG